ncbi:MAG: sigma-70 family RNA polymerase sigma factor [Ignavibacteriaceae bacterium]|nr:sigma-70 family RNA polymerase sigma factor [Ignavibacteriaceae bacterium]
MKVISYNIQQVTLALNISSTDIDLMQRVSSNDSKALEVLYNRYSSLLYTLVKKIVSEEQTAEDILSEIFVIVWRKADLFDFNTGNVYTWLVTLARNKAVDTLRRLQLNNKPDDEKPEFEPYDDNYENKFIIPQLPDSIDPLDIRTAFSIKDDVETALNKLTDAQQYVIYLAYYEGLTQKEIAEKLNIPLPTVTSKIKIALSNLRENLVKGDS